MTKKNILIELWEFLSVDGISKNNLKQNETEAKTIFFKNGLKQSKKELQHIYNLKNYGYYNGIKYKLYFEITG